MENRIVELLVKKKLGTLSLSERTELAHISSENEHLNRYSHTLDQFWDKPLNYDSVDQDQRAALSLQRLNKKIAGLAHQPALVKSKTFNRTRVISIAASLILIIGFIAILKLSSDSELESQNTIVTRKGSKSMIILPDGSRVWINDDSKITYGKSFGKESRELKLEGEAYFDVVKDKTRPFIVHTKTADIKVLGTAFNVKAYADDSNLETTLLRGAVEINIKGDSEQKIRLKPNEKIIIKSPGQAQTTKLTDLAEPKILLINIKRSVQDSSMVKETQWVANRLVFEQEKLADIVSVLERWYNVKIDNQVPASLDIKISGTFEHKSIAEIMDSIHAVTGLNYKMQNNTLTIYP